MGGVVITPVPNKTKVVVTPLESLIKVHITEQPLLVKVVLTEGAGGGSDGNGMFSGLNEGGAWLVENAVLPTIGTTFKMANNNGGIGVVSAGDNDRHVELRYNVLNFIDTSVYNDEAFVRTYQGSLHLQHWFSGATSTGKIGLRIGDSLTGRGQFELDSDGLWFTQYGLGSKVAAPAYFLGAEADGHVVEIPLTDNALLNGMFDSANLWQGESPAVTGIWGEAPVGTNNPDQHTYVFQPVNRDYNHVAAQGITPPTWNFASVANYRLKGWNEFHLTTDSLGGASEPQFLLRKVGTTELRGESGALTIGATVSTFSGGGQTAVFRINDDGVGVQGNVGSATNRTFVGTTDGLDVLIKGSADKYFIGNVIDQVTGNQPITETDWLTANPLEPVDWVLGHVQGTNNMVRIAKADLITPDTNTNIYNINGVIGAGRLATITDVLFFNRTTASYGGIILNHSGSASGDWMNLNFANTRTGSGITQGANLWLSNEVTDLRMNYSNLDAVGGHVFWGNHAANFTIPSLELGPQGGATLGAYGLGGQLGAPAYGLGVDANGLVLDVVDGHLNGIFSFDNNDGTIGVDKINTKSQQPFTLVLPDGNDFVSGFQLERSTGTGFFFMGNGTGGSEPDFLPIFKAKGGTATRGFFIRGIQADGATGANETIRFQATNPTENGAIGTTDLAYTWYNWSTKLMQVLGNGQFQFAPYAGGAFDGTIARTLGIDGSGNMVTNTLAAQIESFSLGVSEIGDLIIFGDQSQPAGSRERLETKEGFLDYAIPHCIETDANFELPPITHIGQVHIVANPAGGGGPITITGAGLNTVNGSDTVNNDKAGAFMACTIDNWWRVD